MICEHVVALGIVLMVREMDDVDKRVVKKKNGAFVAESTDVQPEADFIEVPIAPRFNAYVSGSRSFAFY